MKPDEDAFGRELYDYMLGNNHCEVIERDDGYLDVNDDLAEYFEPSGELYRRYEALEVKTIDSYPTVVQSRMSDLRTGGSTLLAYSSVRYNLDLPEEVFTERYLRSPPRQYLR